MIAKKDIHDIHLQQLSNQTLLKAIIKSEATEKFSKLDSTL
jgi:hypothetical protein